MNIIYFTIIKNQRQIAKKRLAQDQSIYKTFCEKQFDYCLEQTAGGITERQSGTSGRSTAAEFRS